MAYNNPFPYSDDNKRYHTWNYYLKHRYHHKVFKVALNAGLSCPNRDGTCGTGGCTFCGSLGSGECAGNQKEDLTTQFQKGMVLQKKKWPDGKAIAYFQAYTNTYCSLETLKAMIRPFIQMEDVQAIAIATRADCLEQEKIAYLHSLTEQKDIWIELGLQSIHNDTAAKIHRGHTYEAFLDCVKRLEPTNIRCCVHLINSLPDETKEDMLASAAALAALPIHAVKIHMLHIMEHTQMAEQFRQSPFPLLSKEEYIDIVISQLELFPPRMIIQRLTGDGVQNQLITPQWTKKKVCVLNDIDKEMVKRNTWQGRKYKES